MKTTVKGFVQAVNLVPSAVEGAGRMAAVTVAPADPANEKFLAPQTTVNLTVSDIGAFPLGASITIAIEVTPASAADK